ncbi:hypothetical protein BLM15_30695 (plasmid) [Bosea sp. Tri-49]|nr:hypothetical protein BLM15_30695 [Bosea sp. Tri-49]
MRDPTIGLFDHLDDPAGSRFNQHCAVIDYGVAVSFDAILGRHLAIGHAPVRKHRSNANLLRIGVGGNPLFGDIRLEARRVVSNDPADNRTAYAPDYCADRSTDNCTTDCACGSAAGRTALRALRILGECHKRS